MTLIMRSRQHLVKRLDNARYHGPKRPISQVRFLVFHATGGGHPFAESQRWMNKDLDPEGKKGPKGRLSYHYGIDRDGSITRALPTNIVAYSNGDSGWPPVHNPPGNDTTLNPVTINVAWANDDKGEKITEEQLRSGLWLGIVLMEQTGLDPSKVLGHFEVSPGRKKDPKLAVSMREFRQMLGDTEIR